ncbi:lysozyme inhibitor LprI family protein [Paraburkholderia hayleyella]|uniref:lysozyme inhibitor LprI family protein n=1 Tax=Paraburkholderia hayleyella TaxID=2152889 RepID=UPI0012918AE7|nr:lysozyme inhibitor LprI family protein [Paraburkholderia hayleyella]
MRFLKLGPLLLTLNLITVHAAPAQDGPSSKSTDPFLEICAPVKNKVVPGVDLNPKSGQKGDEDCEALYYAPGGHPDYKAAYQCALRKNDRQVLTMSYANGYGVQRDVAAALKIACTSRDGPFPDLLESATHLRKMLSDGSTEKFDQCDDVSSTAGSKHCDAIKLSFDSAARAQRLAAITQAWSPADKNAFATLEKAKNSYLDTYAKSEIDRTDGASDAYAAAARSSQEDSFTETLDLLEKGKFPRASKAAFEQADKALNKAYRFTQRPRSRSAEESMWGAISATGIRETQRAWLRYRDAWVALAAKRYPAVSATAIKTYLTRQRTDGLEVFVPPNSPKI